MSNLKEETLRRLAEEGYKPEDVESVQGGSLRISWKRFLKLANVEYDAGYGAQEVACDLMLIMRDGSWFTRGEYDGSEWWEYHKRPEALVEIRDDEVSTLVCDGGHVGWCSLDELNSTDKDTEADEIEDGEDEGDELDS